MHMSEKIPDLAPETVNAEQDDEDTQAQSVADQARSETREDGLEDSDNASGGIDDVSDVPDLVDRMKQMESSGRIDMDAYRGERNDDDEEGLFGEAGEDD
jgi:hypothetical protein